MKQVVTGAAAAAICAGSAFAGAVERSTQSVGLLFEKGTYAELTFSYFEPSVSGTNPGPYPLIGASSGSMLDSYTNLTLGYKHALTDRLDLGLVLDQPIGANIGYPTGTNYPVEGTTAELKSNAVTGFLRYKLNPSFSVIGGVRAIRTSGEVNLPFAALSPLPYTLKTSTETDFGYVLGIAWEKPEIAARIALTYNSSITHNLDAAEGSPAGGPINNSSFETEIPQSVNLEFQTGIAADTLLFGSIRWVDWTAFKIDPIVYNGVYGSPLVDYQSDRITYNLGLGRKFNDTWSGAILLGYEESNGDITGNLGPTDGYTSVGLAVTYTKGNAKITGGLRYVDIGNATTRSLNGNFTGNHGWGAGIRIGYQF